MELILEEGIEILARKVEIRQIIWNLVLNAVQAMPTGGTLTLESRLCPATKSGSSWEIKIGDTGSGIEEKDKNIILQPFFTTKDGGTGLGLTIVDRIVARYDGKVHIDSILGRGSVFSVILNDIVPERQKDQIH